MKTFITSLLLFISLFTLAQTPISGIVTDSKGLPIEGANIYLEGTYDGATSKEDGKFSFSTSETGTQTLLVSFVSYETFTMVGDVSTMKNLEVKLKDDVNSLDAVVLSAGTFEAGDNSKISVLKPND